MDDNKKLLDEIDSLEDEHTTVDTNANVNESSNDEVIKNNSKNSRNTIIAIIVFLVVVLIVSIVLKNLNEENKDYDTNYDDDFFEDDEDFSSALGKLFDSSRNDYNFDYELDDDDYDYYDDEEEYEDDELSIEKWNEMKSKIEVVNLGKNIDGKLVVKLINHNDINLEDIHFYAVFFDSANNIIAVDEDRCYAFEKGAEQYFVLGGYLGEDIQNYERMDIFFEKPYDLETTYKSYVNYIECSAEEDRNDDKLYVKVKNNSDTKIEDITIAIIFYGIDDKIIDVDYIYFDSLAKGKTDKDYCYSDFYSTDYEEVDYVRYELKVQEAYTDEY